MDLQSAERTGSDTATAILTFRSHQPGSQPCTQWRIHYGMVYAGGYWQIDAVQDAQNSAC